MMRKTIVTFAALMLASGLAIAKDSKVGFVNLQQVVDGSPQAQQAQERLRAEFSPREDLLKQDAKALDDSKKKLEQDASIMAKAELEKKQRELMMQYQQLNQRKQEMERLYVSRRNEELGRLHTLISQVVEEIAKAEQYDLIVNETSVLYVKDTLDLSEKVLEKLRAKATAK